MLLRTPFTPYHIEPMTLEAKETKPIYALMEKIFKLAVSNKTLQESIGSYLSWYYSLNDLCSIDSGLRQFVCEKWLYEEQALENYRINMWVAPLTDHRKPEYRLMLSSIQEDKEKFLIDNIILPTT